MSDMFYVKKIINELERKLFTVLYSRNTEFALVRLLFLKYADVRKSTEDVCYERHRKRC